MLEQITVNFGIPLAYIVFGIALLGMIVFPVLQMVQDFKKALSAFVAIGIILVVFFLCYALAANEPFTVQDINVAAGKMRFFEAGIFLIYLLFCGAFLAILVAPLSRYLK